MTTNKRKKVRRLRGSKYHGGGVKKHRGAGNRGGRGMAGSGKRAHQKKPSILKYFGREYFGKHGFKLHPSLRKEEKIINIKDLPEKEEINLRELGYTKLLSEGNPKMKHKIIIPSYSKKAKEKIEKAGGVILEKL